MEVFVQLGLFYWKNLEKASKEGKSRHFSMESGVVDVWGRHGEGSMSRRVEREGLKREQPGEEIDKRKVGSEKETAGNTDERVDGVGESVVEEKVQA